MRSAALDVGRARPRDRRPARAGQPSDQRQRAAAGRRRPVVGRDVSAGPVGVAGEVIVVAGPAMPAPRRDDLAALGAHLVDIDGPFNFSASINLGAAHATGEHLLLLNDDVEVITADWLARLLDAARPGVGAVGAKLLFEDGTLQHAGHTYRTSLDHVGFGLPGDAPGRGGILRRRREVAGVTAACMLVPFGVFDAVGGLCTGLPANYNDVDLCMKIRAAGWTIVYEPAAVLYHFESRSRVAGIRPEEVELIQRRWLSH